MRCLKFIIIEKFIIILSLLPFMNTHASPSLIKPETTPPSTEGALRLQDLSPVFSQPINPQEKIKNEIQTSEKKEVTHDEKRELIN